MKEKTVIQLQLCSLGHVYKKKKKNHDGYHDLPEECTHHVIMSAIISIHCFFLNTNMYNTG